MGRFLIAMFIGATIAAAVSTSASAWHCLASSPNGAAGTAFGVILERAQSISLRRCINRGVSKPREGRLRAGLVPCDQNDPGAHSSSVSAATSPIPDVPPVMTTVFPLIGLSSLIPDVTSFASFTGSVVR